jgi:NifU-like protein involved in Fe-S cluster formation
MDEAVIQYYKRLLKTGFENSGSFDNPSIFLEDDQTKFVLCGRTGDSLHVFINIRDDMIDNIKYLCTCGPTVNVVLELLCLLVKGKSLAEAKNLTVGDFSQVINSRGNEFLNKAGIAIELLKEGIKVFECESGDFR